jgi:hypothetical protein
VRSSPLVPGARPSKSSSEDRALICSRRAVGSTFGIDAIAGARDTWAFVVAVGADSGSAGARQGQQDGNQGKGAFHNADLFTGGPHPGCDDFERPAWSGPHATLAAALTSCEGGPPPAPPARFPTARAKNPASQAAPAVPHSCRNETHGSAWAWTMGRGLVVPRYMQPNGQAHDAGRTWRIDNASSRRCRWVLPPRLCRHGSVGESRCP